MKENKIGQGNPESSKVAEIEALFKKVEKIRYGKILVSTFKENTIIESRRLVVGSRGFPGEKIMGAIQKEKDMCHRPSTMTLSVVPEGRVDKNTVELKIFDNPGDAEVDYSPSIKFYANEEGRIGCIIDCDLPLLPFDDTKQSDSSRLFIKIISEVSSKVLQTAHSGGGDGGGAGAH